MKDKGLIVLTSCSHRGVVNPVRQAQEVSGVKKVHAIIGGFHLAPYPEDYLRQTLAALKEIDPDYLVPLHCSGEPFFAMAKAAMGPKLVRAFTGTRLVFTRLAAAPCSNTERRTTSREAWRRALPQLDRSLGAGRQRDTWRSLTSD